MIDGGWLKNKVDAEYLLRIGTAMFGAIRGVCHVKIVKHNSDVIGLDPCWIGWIWMDLGWIGSACPSLLDGLDR